MIQVILKRTWSKAFLTSLVLILAAESLTFAAAWYSLDFNIHGWIENRTAQAARISQQVASSYDFSSIDKISKKTTSALFQQYHQKVIELSRQYFQKTGSIYLVVIERGEEYDIDNGDADVVDGGRPDESELRAYASRKTTHTPVPISDDSGTYLAAFTPILSSGNVVGLVAAEYDSAPLSDFQGIVRSAFLLSMLPAILLSLLVSYLLAVRLVEPMMQVFRAIDVSKQGSEQSTRPVAPWDSLLPSEMKVFELLVRGHSGPEIAAMLNLSINTVKTHLSSIYRKTGLSRMELAIEFQARHG
jgi:DNA-binding CsgD family transcriptional regulator